MMEPKGITRCVYIFAILAGSLAPSRTRSLVQFSDHETPLYNVKFDEVTRLQALLRFASDNRVPLGIVLDHSDPLCEGKQSFRLTNAPASQVLRSFLAGTGYSSHFGDGVWRVEPDKVPLASSRILQLRFERFKGIKTTIQGLGIILAGYVRSRLRPTEGYIGDILSSTAAETVDPFTLENASVEKIANYIVVIAGKGAWILYPAPIDTHELGTTRQLYIYGYSDDAPILRRLSCQNPSDTRLK